MATSTVNITGGVTGAPSGSKSYSASLTGTAYASVSVELANGTNTITVPQTPAPKGCIIQLPSTNTALVTLKGIAGDTGISIGKTGTVVLSWDTANVPANFVLSSASAQTGKVTHIEFF